MISLATNADLLEIMDIVDNARELMNKFNNYQWDSNYPSVNDFTNDIKMDSLFVHRIDGMIAGFVCINRVEPQEYASLKWSSSEGAYIIHRMAVHQSMLTQGIATNLINFAESYSRENNIFYIKSDTYMLNTKMLNLFKKLDYNYIGTIDFGKDSFFCCYEKFL